MTRSRIVSTPFAVVPEWVVLHTALSDRAVRLWAVLDRHADATGRAYPSRSRLGELLGCHPNTVDRALAELVEVGAVTVEPHYRSDGSRTSNSYHLWPTIASPPAEAPLPLGGEAPSLPVVEQEGERKPGGTKAKKGSATTASGGGAAAEADPLDAAADTVARQVWEAKSPRPAQPFVAVRKIARSLLAAGWAPDHVAAAMLAAPTISTRAVELQLNRHRPRPADARIDTDRTTPTRREQW